MIEFAKRVSLGFSLILLASFILLWTEAPRRPPLATAANGSPNAISQTPRSIKLALMQMASQPIIDEGAAGVLAGLKETGHHEGTNVAVKRFNAEGDIATANAMAQELTGGGYDLVITLTTGALQAVANANKRQVPHVFGLVTDPTKAGVGIGNEPLDHPAHLVGLGTLQPVAECLQMVKELNPNLKRIGVPWNPAEVNSEICTKNAREACRKLNIEMLEATVENSAAVNEAVASLISRDVDMLWIGGDVTVLSAFELVAKSAKTAHIPVCTCMPGNAARGALLDYGANYYEVGLSLGRLAGGVLNGDEIAKLPVKRHIPPKVFVNKLAVAGLREGWSIPPAVLEKANAVVDENGLHDKTASQRETPK